MIKFSTPNHEVSVRYEPNKGQQWLIWHPKFLGPGSFNILIFFFVGKSISRRRAWRCPFFKLGLCLVNIQPVIWFCYHFLTLFWVIELVISFLRLKRTISKKGPHHALRLEMLFPTKKTKLYIDRTRTEKFGISNESFLTLFWFISPWNLKILSWKFYGSLLFPTPTYPEIFI